MGVIPYYGLASGFLTGKYRTAADFSKSARGGGMEKYLNGRGMAILHALDTISNEYHLAPATIALSWLLSRPAVTAPIASATSAGQLHDLVAIAGVRLDADALQMLDEASAY